MKKSTFKNNESGNVLFLILIAVALFAALSYAVTSSTRSGGGDANDETNLVNSSTITQYPSSVRTAMIRMQISKGVDITDMEFNIPSDFGNCSSSNVRCVFHPSGGAATYAQAPAEVMADGNQGTWVFNAENEVNLIGTSEGSNAPTATNVEVIAFLDGITEGVCRRINTELGISGIPTETGVNFTTNHENPDGVAANLPAFAASGNIETIGGSGVAALDSQPFGCFEQGSENYVYYHVLYEQ